MTEPIRRPSVGEEGPNRAPDGPQSRQLRERYDFDPHSDAPATPPYRRVASASTQDVSNVFPPDYRSEYNVSRDHLNEASTSRANLALMPEKSDWPREKAGEKVDDHDDHLPSQYATASTGKNVHYPDMDGMGRLDNLTPTPGQRFPLGDASSSMPARPVPSRSNSVAGSDVDDEEDEIYDWSDEEDLVDQEAKFEKVMGRSEKKRGWGFVRFLTFFFSTLVGSTILAAALAAAAILLRKYWLRPHWSEDREYVTDNVEAWLFWGAANVLISWWLASIIDFVPHVFTWLVIIVWGTVQESLKAKLELYQTGKGWIKPLFYAACAWVSWVVIFEGVYTLYDNKDESNSRATYTPRVYQVIKFSFFLTFAVCVEKMLIQMIAFSFHRTAFKERLDAVTNATKVLDHLRDYKPKRRTPGGSGAHTPHLMRGGLFGGFGGKVSAEPSEMEAGHVHHGTDVDDGRRKSDSPGPSPRPPKKKGFFGFGKSNGRGRQPRRRDSDIPLQDSPSHSYPPAKSRNESPGNGDSPSGRRTPVSGRQTPVSGGHGRPNHEPDHEAVFVQAAKALKHVALHDARGLRGEGVSGEDTGLVWSPNNAHEAKRLARNLYYAFRVERKRTYLIPSDFYPAYRTPEEAREAFKVFDKDDNGDVTRAEIKTAVMKVYKERRFLARSLRDVSAAVSTLDLLMLCMFLIILVFISLPIFGVSIKSSFSSIYTIFIAASFIFKNSASNAFDSIMFLFVTHPFDTGDRVFIDDENLVVRKMGLFATIFTRVDGSQTYYFNTMLLTKFINNARRSADMAENLEMQVNWRTPQWKLDALEKRINEWIASDEKRWFKSGTSIGLSKIDFQRALFLNIGISHNGTWQDWTMRLARKTAFHAAVQYFCRQLDITYSESPQPIIFTKKEQQWPYQDESEDIPMTPMTPATPHEPVTHPPLQPGPRAMLGFTPPGGKNELRLRRGNKKKLMGAAEGDA